MSGVIVGISGGDLGSTASLNKYAIQCTGREKPHVLFIPTASNDSEGYIKNIEACYSWLDCSVASLCLISETYSQKEIALMFDNADLIYIGGGNTEKMLKIWRQYEIDTLILKAYQDGKVLTGISAGTLIWFRYGFSDSDYFKNPDNWDYRFIECMDVFPYAVCPHYNEEGRSCFDEKLTTLGIDGIALDNDTAIVIEDNRMYIKKARENANAYLLKNNNGSYEKIPLDKAIPIWHY